MPETLLRSRVYKNMERKGTNLNREEELYIWGLWLVLLVCGGPHKGAPKYSMQKYLKILLSSIW